ncbi:hypothetical protein [Novosphingobium malaysiense]|nr:hypothetical protein [Novosphingobium malaysiense]
MIRRTILVAAVVAFAGAFVTSQAAHTPPDGTSAALAHETPAVLR